MARRKRPATQLAGTGETHLLKVEGIHDRIEQHLREMSTLTKRGRSDQTAQSCGVLQDNVDALYLGIGRAQGHIDGFAGTAFVANRQPGSRRATAVIKKQNRLASKVGTMATKLRQKCFRYPSRR